MILSGQSIRKRGIFTPFNERTKHNGMSYGLSMAGYDVRVNLGDRERVAVAAHHPDVERRDPAHVHARGVLPVHQRQLELDEQRLKTENLRQELRKADKAKREA